jgi:hypothetical protein
MSVKKIGFGKIATVTVVFFLFLSMMVTPLLVNASPNRVVSLLQVKSAEKSVKHGDLNEDGAVDALDLALLKKYLLTGAAVKINLSAADVNASGTIDAIDLALLKSYLLGKISGF